MPKARQTCTRCSMRRQKCDRKLPCTRCVRDNQAAACSLEWPEGYNPRIHRKYPNPKQVALSKGSQQLDNAATGDQNDDSDTIGNELSCSPPINSSPPASKQTISLASPRRGQKTPADFGTLLTSVNPYEPGRSSQPVPNASNVDQAGEPLGSDNDDFMDDGYPLPIPISHGGSEQELVFLQSLIPSSRSIQQLVDYHEENLLWFHSGFNSAVFRREVSDALKNSGVIELRSHDLCWCALLFSVMAASLTCANASFARSWGFGGRQRRLLAKQWYGAVRSCLHLGYYASRHHIYSIQAIQVGGVSAHILGFSNEQFVLYGAAYRIAQSLGLQKLKVDTDSEGPDTLKVNPSEVQRDMLMKRETGRKIWIGLCTQDWYSIASSDMYCLHKQQFTTSKPRRINDETLQLVEDHVPISVDFGNYMYDIASLMADYHDETATLEDVSEHYDMILKYDSRLRALGPETCLPPSLLDTAGKPPWVAWARHTCNILHAHKLIMMHRRFLSRSFTNARFAYTRWASVSSAKKILNEIEATSSDTQMPAIWSCQVHLVAAGITLCLDHLHHPTTDPNFAESRKMVTRAINVLKKDESILSSRGVQLLSTLLAGKPRSAASIPCSMHGLPCLGPCEASRQIEITPGLDPSWIQRQVHHAFVCPWAEQASALGHVSSELSSRAPNANNENVGLPDEIQQMAYQHPSFTMDVQELDGNLLAPDLSFFDLFTEYFPTLSGFDNPAVFGDLFH